jgi:phosphohistidine phosphatase
VSAADGRFELYLLRHADAGDPGAWPGDDAQRPLSPKGRKQAERLAEHLARLGVRVDAVVTSPKVRAVETATPVADALGAAVVQDGRLGQALSIGSVEELLGDHEGARRIVLVGHDPDFSELLGDLVGSEDLPMRKGALARIDAERPLRPGSGVLRWLLPPDALK